jgi:thymidylate synthase ThyX
MKTQMRIEEPEQTQCTLLITMTLKEWGNLRDQLSNKWPSCNLASAIIDMVYRLRKGVFGNTEEGTES